MRPRIQYTQHSGSWRRVARIVRANRMLRDRTLTIALREDVVRAIESKPVVIDSASFIARHTKCGYSNIWRA